MAKSVMLYFDDKQSLSVVIEIQTQLAIKQIPTLIHQIQPNTSLRNHMTRNVKKKINNIITITNRNNTIQLLQQGKKAKILQQNYFWIILDTGITPNDILSNVPQNSNVGLIRKKNHGIGSVEECQETSADVFDDCKILQIKSIEMDTVHAIETMAIVLNNKINNFTISTASCNSSSAQVWPDGLIMKDEILKLHNYNTPNGIITFNESTMSKEVNNVEFMATFNKDNHTKLTMIKSAMYNIHRNTLNVIINSEDTKQLFPNKFQGFKNQTIILCKPYYNDSYISSIADILSKNLNFNYILKDPPDGQYGTPQANSTIFTGCVGELQLGRATIGASFFTKTKARHSVVDFSYPLYEEQNAFMLPRQQQPSKMWSVFRPLNTDSWCLIIFFLVLSAFIIYLLAYFSPFTAWNLQIEGSIADEVWFQEYLWSAFGSFFQQGQDFYPCCLSARTAMAFWWFLTVIIIAAYTADLTSYLTITEVVEPIKTLEKLADSQIYKPIGMTGTNIKDLFSSAKSGVYAKLNKKMRYYDDYKEYRSLCRSPAEKVIKNNFACVGDSTFYKIEAQKNCKNLFVLEETFNTATIAFMYPKDAYYATEVDYYLEKLSESGVIQRLYKKSFLDGTINTCASSSQEHEADAIGMETFLGTAIVSLSLMVLGFIIFGLEILWTKVLKRSVTDLKFY